MIQCGNVHKKEHIFSFKAGVSLSKRTLFYSYGAVREFEGGILLPY